MQNYAFFARFRKCWSFYSFAMSQLELTTSHRLIIIVAQLCSPIFQVRDFWKNFIEATEVLQARGKKEAKTP
jgi:hypothetical protein